MIHTGLSAIIIGNEVLTAKVVEANGSHLVRRCRERGVRLASVHVIPDEVDCIVETLALARRRARFVVTSGGVGPTHDDVTVRAVALALGRKIVSSPRLVELLRAGWKDGELPAAALRMAEAPEGSELVESKDAGYPVLMCDRVFMLPGVPEFFRAQLEAVLQQLPGDPVTLRNLYLRARESDIARTLDAIAMAMPHVAFGSYPTFDPSLDHLVKITIEHGDARQVEAAAARLRAELPGEVLVRED
jgi:molybdenum cofactor synthesis domain-containing protein